MTTTKRFLSFVMVLCMVMSLLVLPVSAATTELIGDLNGDGAVTTDDVVILLLYITMPDQFPLEGHKDFDGSTVVDADDAIQLLLHVSMPDAFPLKPPASEPENLVLAAGDNEITLDAGDTDGKTWTYVAQSTGTLTIEASAVTYDWIGEGEYIECDMSFGFSRMYCLTVDGVQNFVPTVTIDVVEGQLVEINLLSANYYATKATLTLTEAVAGDDEVVSSQNVVLAMGDVDGETISYTAQATGSLIIEVTALEYDWEGNGVYTECDMGFGFGMMYCLTVDGVQNYTPSVTIDVVAGQLVEVNLMSANGFATNATLTFTETTGEGGSTTEPTVPSAPGSSADNPIVIETLPYSISFYGGMDAYYAYTTTEAGIITVSDLEGGIMSLPNGEAWDYDADGNYVIPVEANYTLVLNPWTLAPELSGDMIVSFSNGSDEGGDGNGTGTAYDPYIINELPYTIPFFAGMDQYYSLTTTQAGVVTVTALEGGILSLPNGDAWDYDENGNYAIPVEANYTLVLNPWTMAPEISGDMVVTFTAGGGEVEPSEPSTPAEIVYAAYSLAAGETMEGPYTLTGIISKVTTPYSEQYGNVTVEIVVDGLTDMPIACYRLQGEGADQIGKGDTITVTGSLTNYNDTSIQFAQGCTLDAWEDTGVETVIPTTPEEIVNAAYALANNEALNGTFTLTGVITEIDSAFSSQYNNVSVVMVVGDMTDKPILCYRLKGEGADQIAVGDTITVTGALKNYNGTVEFDSGCTLDSWVDATPDESTPDESTPEEASSVSISFADVANRTVFTTSQQVWVQNGITVTNDKAASTNAVADYSNPARFYKGSNLTVACAGMTKIEFYCNTASYATALANSISGSTVDGKVVTVEFATATDLFTIENLSAQVRMDSITVYVAATETEPTLLTWQQYVALTGAEQRAYKESFANSDDYYAWLEGAQAAFDAEHESEMDGTINMGDLVNKG